MSENLKSPAYLCEQKHNKITFFFFFFFFFLLKNTWVLIYLTIYIEPAHGKTNKMTCAPSEDSDQPD